MKRAVKIISLMGALIAASLICGCSKRAPDAEPVAATKPEAPPAGANAADAAHVASSGETIPASPPPPIDEPEVDRPRPGILVFVAGGSDDRTIFRGWPVQVHAALVTEKTLGELTVRGPSPITPVRRGDVWIIPADVTAKLPLGTYIFAIGSGESTTQLVDPPAKLTPELVQAHRRVSVQTDLALGNTAEAAQTATAWVAAEPKSPEPHALLGDALLAAGDKSGAARSYDRARRLIPPHLRTPRSMSANEPDPWEGAVTTDPTTTTSSAHPVAVTATTPTAVATPVSPGTATPPATASSETVATASSGAGEIVASAVLNDAAIRADRAGQWAATARAGSQYGSSQYSAAQATGAPNVAVAGNSPEAWCPADKDTGTDWLEVAFAKPVHATEVRVRQNDTVGAIAKIEAVDTDGQLRVWWEGTDPHVAAAVREIVWFAVRVPKTDYLVAKIRITLNLAAVRGWKEIDAVQLVAAP